MRGLCPSWKEAMAIQLKRMYFDLVARDYASNHPEFDVISGSHTCDRGETPAGCASWNRGKAFTLRCYLSLQGEDSPVASSKRLSFSETPETGAERTAYRYDWAFGITLIEGFYWDWRKELADDGALAIHLVLKPEPFAGGPEAIPVAAILSTLHPSKNTRSLWEQTLPMVPKAAAEMAKTGASALPLLNYLSSGLMFGSNVLASYTDNQRNWFLYQFLDEKLQCPVVEWRISKKVLIEYGPLIRGTLFLSFQNPASSQDSAVRILLRPQIRYCQADDICYIIPTQKLEAKEQVFLDVRPTGRDDAGA
jgi:hypothetical protein